MDKVANSVNTVFYLSYFMNFKNLQKNLNEKGKGKFLNVFLFFGKLDNFIDCHLSYHHLDLKTFVNKFMHLKKN